VPWSAGGHEVMEKREALLKAEALKAEVSNKGTSIE
jgi:hypothetical protein